MKRFFGLMPSDEIKVSKNFKTGSGLIVRIDAGENGWTIIYADASTEFADCKVPDTTENNFEKALTVLKTHFRSLKEV